MKGWFTQFQEDCLRWRGSMLTGDFAHWCGEWDGLPVDETCNWEVKNGRGEALGTCGEWPCGCYINRVKWEDGIWVAEDPPRKLTDAEVERLWPNR